MNLSWDDVLTEEEKAVLAGAGMGRDMALGKTPALLIVDAQYSFLGLRSSLSESTKVYPKSAGQVGWKAAENIRVLVDEFHKFGYPIFYTKSVNKKLGLGGTVKATKGGESDGPNAEAIVDEIAPTSRDVVVEKIAASGFHGTPLVRMLTLLGVDTLFVTGGTTSGCVRASVVDAFSYGYKVVVVPEGVFDRLKVSHRASLLDMFIKYSNLMNVEETKEYLERCGSRATVSAYQQ
jgi:maleamate amidohydrolase